MLIECHYVTAVDDFEFDYDQFSPFMEPSFHHLFKLLTNVESCDSKVGLNSTKLSHL